MIENLSKSGYEMLIFEHEMLVRLIQILKINLDHSAEMNPVEREMWRKKIDALLCMCESNEKIFNSYNSVEISKRVTLN